MDEKLKPVGFAPVMTKERFAELTGLEEGVIRGMIDKGHLPSVKIGKHRLVNVALLNTELLTEAWEK